jgi:hypothetical protein
MTISFAPPVFWLLPQNSVTHAAGTSHHPTALSPETGAPESGLKWGVA